MPPNEPTIDIPVRFRPDLLPDGNPKMIEAGEVFEGEVVPEPGLMLCVDEAQLVDVIAFVNQGKHFRETPAQVSLDRNLDRKGRFGGRRFRG